MAYAFPEKLLYARWERMLNPCRWCGEPARLERNNSNWSMETQLRATCEAVHDPVYLGSGVETIVDMARYYDRLFQAVQHLAGIWNERHDGPGFIAGLA